jgi:hypothetical protein
MIQVPFENETVRSGASYRPLDEEARRPLLVLAILQREPAILDRQLGLKGEDGIVHALHDRTPRELEHDPPPAFASMRARSE